MSPSQFRISAWTTWFLVALGSMVWLPRLLGTEPQSRSLRAERPKAVLLGITTLPEPVIQQEVSTSRELRLLIPDAPESDAEVPTLAAPRQPAQLTDIEPSEETSSRALILKPASAGETPLEESLPGQSAPAKPQTSLRFAPPLETVPSQLTVPPQPLPNEAIAMPGFGSAVKYWIVSSRCCRQTPHKCGVSCRFVCHAVTEDGQCLPVSYEQMLASQIPGAPTCVLVHGSFTRMQDVCSDAECTSRWLRGAGPQVPVNFIYYTWPSEGPFAILPHNPFTTLIPSLDFGILGHRAELNGFYVADLIGSLSPTTTVSLIGHSLGARAIASALHLMGGGTVRGQARCNPVDGGQRIRVVLAAAAIEHDWLNPGERFGCALNRAECLLNLRNECDLAMALYPLRRPFSSRSLARAGFTCKDQCKLGEHLVQVSELDVTPLIGLGHGWPHYYHQPGIAAAIAPYLFFEAAGGALPNPAPPR